MIFTTQVILSLIFIALWLYRRQNERKLPPGPYPLPIFGNLHMLGNLPHRSLDTLAKKYGPIMMIRLGLAPTVIVSSPQAAELFLKTHDKIFASRPKAQASEYMTYGTKGLAFTEYGPYWRSVRKLCTMELLTPAKINSFTQMRKEEVESMVEKVKNRAATSETVDVTTMIDELIEDITCRMVFGRCKDDRFDLKGIVQEGLRLASAFNVSDFVPWLAPFDLQGLKRSMKAISKEMDKILETVIDEHEQNSIGLESRCMDFTDTLLSLRNDCTNYFSSESYIIDRTNVKAIMVDMVMASIDTTAITIQWTFLELLRNPTIMRKVQVELEDIVGSSKTVEEVDLTKLSYLDMVVKESLRLHPAAPLLIPHESTEDITISGYFIPKKSKLLVNIWAIGHNPSVWSDNADEFYPERFENSDVDLKGHDFRLLPFGSGRRGCPGMQSGLTMVRIVLAQLVHCFDWKVVGELDTTEKVGVPMRPANKIFAVPRYRLFK